MKHALDICIFALVAAGAGLMVAAVAAPTTEWVLRLGIPGTITLFTALMLSAAVDP